MSQQPSQVQRTWIKAKSGGSTKTKGTQQTNGAPPPKPTTPPPQQPPQQKPVKTDKEWLREYDEKLKSTKGKLKLVTANDGLDKDKLQPLNTLMKAALDLKTKKDYEHAIEKLDDFEKEADKLLKTPAAKQSQRATNAERSTFARELAVDMIVSDLPPEIDLSMVQAMVESHRKQVPIEIQVFAGFNDLQDVLEIKDANKRKTALQNIDLTIFAAKEREKAMIAELQKLPPLPKDATEDQQKAFRNVFSLAVGMCEHIPEEFLASWSPNFNQRVTNLCMNHQDKKDKLEDLRKNGGFSKTDQERHVAVFKQGIEPRSTKEFERHDFFFDQLITSPDPNELKEIYKVQDELIAKAREIKDCGGSIKDCEKVLNHIAKTWWPPEFVEELQAWRKTERLLQRERVHALFEEKKLTMKDAVGCVEFVLGTVSQLNDIRGIAAGGEGIKEGKKTDEINSWLNDKQIVAKLGEWGGQANTFWGNGKEWAEAAMSGDFSKLKDASPEKILDVGSKVMNSLNTVTKTVQNICKNTGFDIPEKSLLATQVLPGIAIATAGVDLALALKNLAIHIKRTAQTSSMKKKAEMEWALGEAEDGGAFVNTLKNELGGRKVQMAKDTLDVTTKSLALSGSIGEMTGIGTPAGTAIKIVGKAIEIGGKVVFTNIEWGLASRAKSLMKEAQAGNPIARMQIFEDCNLYAKMYIAILVKDGNALARKFIEDRGIEEGDLDQAMSLKILREAMLKDVDQKDETEVADSLLEANVEGFVGGSVMKVGKAMVAKIAQVKEIGKDRKVAYDESWKFTGTVLVTKDQWDAVKKDALKAGLFEENTGVGGLLKAVETAKAAVTKAKPNELQAKRIALMDALNAADAGVRSWAPMTNPQGQEKKVTEHKGMVLYCVAMHQEIAKQTDDVDQGPVTDPTTKPPTRDETQGAGVTKACGDWTAVKPANLEPADWKANFDDAVKKCHLENKDNGIEAALKAVKKAVADPNFADNAQDKPKQRTARLEAQAKYNALMSALQGYWTGCGPVEEMRKHLNLMIQAAAAQLSDLDKKLFGSGVTWKNPAASKSPDDKFTAAAWDEAYKSAETAGVVVKGKGSPDGVSKALKTAGEKKTALDKTTDAKAKVTARNDFKKALTLVFVSATKYSGGQGTLVKELADYVTFLINDARRRMVDCEGEQNKVDYSLSKATPKLEAADFRKVYDTAVKEGAIEPHDGTAKKVESAITKYLGDKDKLASLTDWKKKREMATQIKGELAAVQKSLGDLHNQYSDHEKFGTYVQAMAALANAPDRLTSLNKILDGEEPGQDFPATAWKWSDTDWQNAKKVAVAKGVLGDAKTNFGAALTKGKKEFDEAKEEGNKQDSDKYQEKKKKAVTAIGTVKSLAQAMMNSTKNGNLRKYFDDAAKDADRMIGQLK
jgi:hypothetical protein